MKARATALATFHFLRQQMKKPAGQQNHCLADYIAPAAPDYLGGFAVGIHGGDELAKRFAAEHDDYSGITAKALADRLAEAFAEYLHEQARIAWGFGTGRGAEQGGLDSRGLPRHPARRRLSRQPGSHREENALRPAGGRGARGRGLDGIVCHAPGRRGERALLLPPGGKIFGVGKIDRDQVADYAARKGETVEYVGKWLAPILGF